VKKIEKSEYCKKVFKRLGHSRINGYFCRFNHIKEVKMGDAILDEIMAKIKELGIYSEDKIDLASDRLKKLRHHYDSTVGLMCTDTPGIVPENIKHLFFKLKG